MREASLGLLAALVACAPDDEEIDLPIDVCGQDEPVQILALGDEQVIGASGSARFEERWLFGIRTFEIPLTRVDNALGDPELRHFQQIDAAIISTGDCGEDRRVVAEGIDTIAERLRHDEPWLGCSHMTGGLYWFDPTGATPARLVSDQLSCNQFYLVFDESVVFYGGDGELVRARLEDGDVVVEVLLDGIEFSEYLPPLREAAPDDLVAVLGDERVVSVDLRTGNVATLTEGIASAFSISPNRRWLVWYQSIDGGLTSRLWLRDLQEGGDTPVSTDDWVWVGVDTSDSFVVARGEAMFVPSSTRVIALPSLRSESLDGWFDVIDARDGEITLDLRDGRFMRLDPETGERSVRVLEYDELIDGAFWSVTLDSHERLDLPEAFLPWNITRATFEAPEREVVRERVFSRVDLGDDRWIVGSDKDENGLVQLEYLDGATLEHHAFADDVVPGAFDARSDASIAAPWRTDELIYQVHTRASDRTGVWRVRFTP